MATQRQSKESGNIVPWKHLLPYCEKSYYYLVSPVRMQALIRWRGIDGTFPASVPRFGCYKASFDVLAGDWWHIFHFYTPLRLLEGKLCPLLPYSVELPYMAVYSNYNTIKSFLLISRHGDGSCVLWHRIRPHVRVKKKFCIYYQWIFSENRV